MNYTAKDFPSCIYLETSVRCNAKCPICPSPHLRRPDMPFLAARRIIDQCVGHQVDELHPFQYADPLVWPHLIALLEYARKKLPNTKHILYCNGGLLTEEMARALIGVPIDSITFSIDGATKAVYEAHRPPLVFETVRDNVLRFLEINEQAGHPVHTRAHFTFTKRNEHERNAFYEFWADKADEVTFHECDSRAEQFGGEKRYYTQASIEPCAQPFNGLFVHSNGNVAMCCIDSKPDAVLGNVNEQSIEDIWHGPELTYIRELHNARRKTEIPLCRACSVRN